jgi:tetratricopeptide (TPR) repeat protein
MLGKIASVRSAVAFVRGDMARTAERAREAISLLGPGSGAPSEGVEAELAVPSFYLGMVYYQQARFGEAEPLLEQSRRSFEGTMNASNIAAPTSWLGIIAAGRGQLDRAARLLKEAIDLDPAAATAHLILGHVHYERNDLEKAAFHQEQAVKLFRLTWPPSNKPSGTQLETACLRLACTRMAQGEVERGA